MPSYKDDLEYQREYARSAIRKNERAGTMTRKKRVAYETAIHTADRHAGKQTTGRESHSDAAANFLRFVKGATLLGREHENLKAIEEKTRR